MIPCLRKNEKVRETVFAWGPGRIFKQKNGQKYFYTVPLKGMLSFIHYILIQNVQCCPVLSVSWVAYFNVMHAFSLTKQQENTFDK